MRADRVALPVALLMARIDPVGRSVLADNKEFFGARRDQLLRLAQDRIDPAARQFPAQLRDDAKGAGMVAALRNLEVAVVPRSEFDIWLRDQIDEWPLAGRCVFVHRLHHLLILMRARHREHLGMRGADRVGLLAKTTRYDDAAILGNCLANGGKAFFLGAIEKAASVHQHHIGASVIGAHRIAISAQPGEDTFGIDQRLRASKRHHADTLGVGESGCSVHIAPRPTLRSAVALQLAEDWTNQGTACG